MYDILLYNNAVITALLMKLQHILQHKLMK